MAVDASIALQTRLPQIDDPTAVRAKQLQLRDLMSQGQMRDMQMQQAQRAQQEEMRFADLYRGAVGPDGQIDYGKLTSGAASAGMGARIPGLQKQQAEVGKAMDERTKAKLELVRSQYDAVSGAMQSLLADPELSWEKAKDLLVAQAQTYRQFPEMVEMLSQEAARLPPDPARLRQYFMQKLIEGQKGKDRLDALLPKTEVRNMGGTDQAFSTNQLTGEVTAGQQFQKTMTPGEVARNKVDQAQLGISRENTGIARENLGLRRDELSKPFEVTGADGKPVLVRQDKQGNITPVEGYAPKGAAGGNKPLASSAAKQLTEARDNAATIDRLTKGFKSDFASKGVLGAGANLSLGAKSVLGTDGDSVDWWKNYRKQAELVERHALFGAALTPTEQASWQSADISPGMDSTVIERNLRTRQALTKKIFENTQQDLIDAGHSESRIRAIGGRNTDVEPVNPAPAAKPPPKAGAVVDGFIFMGGDPSKQENWKAR